MMNVKKDLFSTFRHLMPSERTVSGGIFVLPGHANSDISCKVRRPGGTVTEMRAKYGLCKLAKRLVMLIK